MEDQTVEIVIDYADKDQTFVTDLMRTLESSLFLRINQGQVSLWHQGKILPGRVIEAEKKQHWQQGRIFLLVASIDFIQPGFAFRQEIEDLMKRYEEGKVDVIPVLYRPCPWKHAPFGHLQSFPALGPHGAAVFLSQLARDDREEYLSKLAEEVETYVKQRLQPQSPDPPAGSTVQAPETQQVVDVPVGASGVQTQGVQAQPTSQHQLVVERWHASEQQTIVQGNGQGRERQLASQEQVFLPSNSEPRPPSFAHGYALLMGVGGSLPVSVQDAKALYRLLVNPQRAGYPPDHVTLLTEQEATRDGILQALDRLIEQVKHDPEATVVIYFSGHGGTFVQPGGTTEYFLLPYDYHPNLQEQRALSGQVFGAKVQAIDARKLVVLLDCCHAGGIASLRELQVNGKGEEQIAQFQAAPMPPDLPQRLQQERSRIIVASSRADEFSYAYPEDPYSVFTTCLLEVLSGQAGGVTENTVGILHVVSYLLRTIPTRTGGKQRPLVDSLGGLDADFALCAALPEHEQMHDATLTTERRQIVRGDLAHLIQARTLLSNKIHKIRLAIIIETDASVLFKLRQQLQEAERELARLDGQIDDLEQRLGS